MVDRVAFDPGMAILRGLQVKDDRARSALQNRLMEAQDKRADTRAGLENILLRQRIDQGDRLVSKEDRLRTTMALSAMDRQLNQLPEDQREPAYQRLSQHLTRKGFDIEGLGNTYLDARRRLGFESQMARNLGIAPGDDVPAGQREFEAMTAGLSPEERQKAARIRLGLSPRAVGSAATTIAETGKTADVARSEAEIAKAKAGATEAAKLAQQLKLKPEIEKAVFASVAKAKEDAKIAEEDRSNATAMTLYDTAMGGLVDALGGTTTGPVAGWLPAVTANQQIADGAVAAMAPILKQMFRAAGEGTFTDQDQKLLMDMVPTRKDKPKARRAKLENIDAIVRAKLRQPAQAAEFDPALLEFMTPEERALFNDAN